MVTPSLVIVAALGAERHLHGVGELVDAALQRLASGGVEGQDLGHVSVVLSVVQNFSWTA
jgi:hypothetical protein